jgi:hypothetical protein
MEDKRSQRLTLLVALAITGFGFLGWLAGLLFAWLCLRVLGLSTDLWAMIEALSTAVAAAAVLGAGFIAYRELSEVASSRQIRWVFQNLPDDPEAGIRSLPPEGQAAVKRVLNSLDHVAFLTQADWIPEEVVMPWMNPMVVKAWIKLGPYVAYESRRRQEPDYYEHARQLAERCIAWRAENLPDAEIRWLDDAL